MLMLSWNARRFARRFALCTKALALAFGCAGQVACFVDVGACGRDQEKNAYDLCVCMEGFRLSDSNRCVPCGANERSEGNLCECKPGLSRDAQGVCTSVPDGGAAPPSGQGEPCETAQDCADKEASYCETLQAHVCLVPDCEVGGQGCSEGFSCCDLTTFELPTLCVREGSCPKS